MSSVPPLGAAKRKPETEYWDDFIKVQAEVTVRDFLRAIFLTSRDATRGLICRSEHDTRAQQANGLTQRQS